MAQPFLKGQPHTGVDFEGNGVCYQNVIFGLCGISEATRSRKQPPPDQRRPALMTRRCGSKRLMLS